MNSPATATTTATISRQPATDHSLTNYRNPKQQSRPLATRRDSQERMITSQSKGLNTAQAAIYGLLSLPTLLILVRHGKRGIIGWFYLFIFETLRIAGCAIILSDPQSSGGSIISSIGLSPLLLATLGILHEA